MAFETPPDLPRVPLSPRPIARFEPSSIGIPRRPRPWRIEPVQRASGLAYRLVSGRAGARITLLLGAVTEIEAEVAHAALDQAEAKGTSGRVLGLSQPAASRYLLGDPALFAPGYLVDCTREVERRRSRRATPPPVPCFVYLMARTGLLKIGISKDPDDRANTLSNECGEDVRVLCAVLYADRGQARAIESSSHDRFAEHRLRGEWFRDVAEIRDYFAGLVDGSRS